MPQPRLTALDEKEILRYLGYGGQKLEADFIAQLHRCMAAVAESAKPRAVYRRFTLEGSALKEAALTLEGEDAARRLSGCHGAIVVAATVGVETERLVMRAQLASPADALIMDACASAATENICDNFEADLRRELEAGGEYLTARFSPGYGDFPISQQREILAAVNAGRAAGITLTETNIMIPRKSVSAIMGISKAPTGETNRGCGGCALYETCAFRKEGTSCEKA